MKLKSQSRPQIMGRCVLAIHCALVLPSVAAADGAGDPRNKAKSLANAPSLMEKARNRQQFQSQQPRKAPNAKSLFALLRWAARLTGRELPAGIKPPALVGLPIDQLKRRVCPERPTNCASVVAAYGLKDGAILHSDKIDMSDPIDRSYLLHELVHFLQHQEAGEQVTSSCESILRWERHAYVAQSRYLAKSGHPFPIDEMMKLTYCPS